VEGITLDPGTGQTFLWDGSSWGPTTLGITEIPVPQSQGGTGSSSGNVTFSSYNGLELTEGTDGFTVAGGTDNEKTLTVDETKALSAKADKDTLHTIAAASGATELDREDGSVFDVTATADISISYANFETVDGLVIYATNWGAHTITLPAGTEFGGGTGPEFTVAGTDIIVVTTKDGGTTTEFLVAEQDVKEAS
jgi:hypothetical protein